MEYLDHIISDQGISRSETKVHAIRDAPEPTSVTEPFCLPGLTQLLRAVFAKFVSDLASLVCVIRQESTVEVGI